MRWAAAAALLLLAAGRPAGAADPDGSGAIVLKDAHRFDVGRRGGTYTVRTVVEIRDESGNDWATGSAPQNAFTRVKSMTARVRDRDGNEIKRLSDSDIHTVTLATGGVFHSDDGRRVYSLRHDAYPYVFESETVVEFNTLLVWPSWAPQVDVPLREAELVVSVEPGVEFAMDARGAPEPVTGAEGKRRTWTWRVGPLEARDPQGHAPPEDEEPILVQFAPLEFEVEGKRGRLDTWTGLAEWFAALSAGRSVLDDDQRRQVRALVPDDLSAREKVRALYSHLQEKCRYVAIELGVGGWRPHAAKETLRNHYGDCKDLSMLLVGMLDVVGVTAYPALTLTRANGVVTPAFPRNAFDHCTVMVPLEADTVWVECTSKFHRLGDLPAQVEGSDALVVTGAGGFLARMPVSAARDNAAVSRLDGALQADGTLVFTLECATTGNRADAWRGALFGADAQRTRDWALALVARALPSAVLGTVTVSGAEQQAAGPVTLRVAGTAEGFAAKHGGGLVVNLAVLHRAEALRQVPAEQRRTPVFFPYAFVERDSATIRLPPGLALAGAAPAELANAAGRVRSVQEAGADGVLRWSRELRLERRYFAREEYPEVAALLAEAARRDRAGVELVWGRGGR